MRKTSLFIFILIVISAGKIVAQKHTNQNLFRQLGKELPTPNTYRTVSGRPGPDYFQQQVDYDMDIALDENEKTILGEATITYHNNSPEPLSYLWLQLDQNIREQNSFGSKIRTDKMPDNVNIAILERLNNDFDGGFKIAFVKDAGGNDLKTVINHTVMKVILPEAIPPGGKTRVSIKWRYNLNNVKTMRGRSGYEPLNGGKENIFAIAQFYPRLCVFNDMGWQIKQFVRSEFALEFGNFDVGITVPSDHIVAATGVLKNEEEVLSPVMQERLDRARESDEPVLIVTGLEAKKNAKNRVSDTRTWQFHAENVRDFAFASSRKFIWDAMVVRFPGNNVLAMSFYPEEGNPLWGMYSTKTIAHTLKTYSKYTFDYPYPSAISVSFSFGGGMEYPMICFNSGRPNEDGSYSERTKNWVIGVIQHEVGHNWFPMIVNSDERQWAWMDEGLNVFLQGITMREWDTTQNWAGKPIEMQKYMNDDKNTIVPIMTNADALLQAGMNSYRKPAVGLTILRETILGRELFDQAFKEYAQTWMFKLPQPADFFRIMEDASGVDLDWFWRGWFFSTEHVDLAISNVKVFEPVSNMEKAKRIAREQLANERIHIAEIRDRGAFTPAIEQDQTLKDKYDKKEPLVDEEAIKYFNDVKGRLNEDELTLLEKNQKFYEITFASKGGMPMPIVIQFEFEDGSKELQRIPAEIWTKNHKEVTKVFRFSREVISITLDPFLEIADMEMKNNYWPRKTERIYFNIQK